MKLVSFVYHALPKRISMKIFRALGLGLVIIILQFLVPRLFNSFEEMLITLFDATQTAITVSETALTDLQASVPQIPTR